MSDQSKIVKIEAGGHIPELGTPAAVLVSGTTNIDATCEALRQAGAPCTRIAFVSKGVKRSRRRLAANLGLSQCYGCPCQVFHSEDEAREWLTAAQ